MDVWVDFGFSNMTIGPMNIYVQFFFPMSGSFHFCRVTPWNGLLGHMLSVFNSLRICQKCFPVCSHQQIIKRVLVVLHQVSWYSLFYFKGNKYV